MISIGPDNEITMRYTMRDADGEKLLDSANQRPMKFTFGSGEIWPELEDMMIGMTIGEKKNFTLSPELISDFNESYSVEVVIDNICPVRK